MSDIVADAARLPEPLGLYALIGMCVSEVAEIEWFLFECYLLTSGEQLGSATEQFNASIKFKHKRRLADAAVRGWAPGAKLIPEWEKLVQQLQKACGPDGARNLVAHNPVRAGVYAAGKLDAERIQVVSRWEVAQNENQVMVGRRPDRVEDLASMSAHVRELKAATRAIMNFWNKLVRVSEGRA